MRVSVEPADHDGILQQQVDELLGAVQHLGLPRSLRAVLEGQAVVVAEDQHELALGLRLLELALEPAELHVGHGAVGSGDLIARVEAERADVRRQIGLPPRLAGIEVALGEPVPHRTRRGLRAEVLRHELALLEQIPVAVRGDAPEPRPPEREPECVDRLLERAAARGVPVQDAARRAVERVRLLSADGERVQLRTEVERPEEKGVVVSADGIPGCGQADRVDRLGDRLREQVGQPRKAVVAERAAGRVAGAVRPRRLGPRLHPLVRRACAGRIDAQSVHQVDVPAQLEVRVHIGAVARHDRGAHRRAGERAVPRVRERLDHRGGRVRTQRVVRVERRSPGRVVLHDHRLDAARRLRIDHVQVRQVPQVATTDGMPRGRHPESCEGHRAGDVRLAGAGGEATVAARDDGALPDRLQEGRRDVGGGRCGGRHACQPRREVVDAQAGGRGEHRAPEQELSTGQYVIHPFRVGEGVTIGGAARHEHSVRARSCAGTVDS